MDIILASNSPRRKQILEEFGYPFKVKTEEVKEEDKGSPKKAALFNAMLKAKKVFDNLSASEKIGAAVIGADTVVTLNGKIIGKPKGKEDAKSTLKTLSGKKHYVLTGFCIIAGGRTYKGVEKTAVIFNNLSDELIEDYVIKKRPLDKAGAYGIQDGYPLVKRIKAY